MKNSDIRKVAFITTSKGRLHHIKQTLPFITALRPSEIIVVDYNCPDKTADWIESNTPQVKVVRVPDEQGFNVSKARNIGAKVSNCDWLCFIDADIVIHGDWFTWMKDNLTPGYFYQASTDSSTAKRDAYGTFICPRKEFLEIGGYDENYCGWGGEDSDLYFRLSTIARLKSSGYPSDFVNPIPHDDAERDRFYSKKHRADTIINKLYFGSKLKIYSTLTNNISDAALNHIATSIRDQIGNLSLPQKKFKIIISDIHVISERGESILFELTIEQWREYITFGPRRTIYTIRQISLGLRNIEEQHTTTDACSLITKRRIDSKIKSVMHIVHTESSLGWGGQELRILSESQGMIERGHRVTLLTPLRACIFDEARRRGIETIALPIEQKRPQGFVALRKWFKANPPDVVNTHSSTDSWLAGLAIFSLGNNIPIVRTRHISTPVRNSYLNRWLFGKSASRVVTTGKSLRLDLISTLGIDANRVRSIPTGVDLNRFSPASPEEKSAARCALGLPENALVIGIAATLRSWKGHDDLLAAFQQLAASISGAHLLIAGDGPQYEKLASAIAKSTSRDRIHLLGHREDVPIVMAAMDIFALPSYANEGVPQAILQAMACALPVVSTTIGAISDAVIDGESGTLLPPRHPVRLTNELARLASEPALRLQMGNAGRARVISYFSRPSMLDAMEEIFSDVQTNKQLS